MKIKYIIDADFGSDFQKDSAIQSLESMLRAWNEFYESTHKKTKIVITATKED